MDTRQLRRYLDEVAAIAVRAGEAILEVARGGDSDVRKKQDGSPVTRADMAAHAVIADGLRALGTGWPLLSEEGDPHSVAASLDSDSIFWLVDPLDGTKEFLKDNGEYTVNIALVEHTMPVMGVVYAPACDELYAAIPGGDAFVRRGDGRDVPLEGGGTGTPVVAVVSRSHPSAETDTFLERFAVTRRVQRGSSLKLCAVAAGESDLYPRFGPTSLWDTAAGAAVARAAGCRVVTPAGDDLRYDPAAGLLVPGFIVYAPETVTLHTR